MASVYAIEGSDSLLLMNGDYVINGRWRLESDSEGMYIPDWATPRSRRRRIRVRCVMKQAPPGEDYNDILEKAREMMAMPLFDRPGRFYNNYLGEGDGGTNDMGSGCDSQLLEFDECEQYE